MSARPSEIISNLTVCLIGCLGFYDGNHLTSVSTIYMPCFYWQFKANGINALLAFDSSFHVVMAWKCSSPLLGEPLVTCGFPSERASNTEL